MPREWYGTARFDHPSAAELPLLQNFFPSLVEKTSIVPSKKGETVEDLHNRCAYALERIITDIDALPTSAVPQSIVICSHAAAIIAIGRALTGNMPDDANEVDFHTYTCSISKFVRRDGGELKTPNPSKLPTWKAGDPIPAIEWRGGEGVGRGWDCVQNAATGHLTNGGERDW
jgi:transcription factor C subunit 7